MPTKRKRASRPGPPPSRRSPAGYPSLQIRFRGVRIARNAGGVDRPFPSGPLSEKLGRPDGEFRGSYLDVSRLWAGVPVHGRRAGVLPVARAPERTEAVPGVPGCAQDVRGQRAVTRLARRDLLELRQADAGAFRADGREACVLPGLLPDRRPPLAPLPYLLIPRGKHLVWGVETCVSRGIKRLRFPLIN